MMDQPKLWIVPEVKSALMSAALEDGLFTEVRRASEEDRFEVAVESGQRFLVIVQEVKP